jgi:molybdopterin-guanine dinucleotide biosynthesis protein A
LSQPAGLILAGGQSSRLGVPRKALAEVGGAPLLRRIIDRLSGQAAPLLLSVHETDPQLEGFGCEQVVDVAPRHRGPLIGLASGLLRLECRGLGEWLLLCPCDAPFVPTDLAARLAEAALEEQRAIAVACYRGVPQPVFSLWHLDTLAKVKSAVMERGRGGLMRMLDDLPHALVEWPDQDPAPFFNVNTPDDLALARRLVDGSARKD